MTAKPQLHNSPLCRSRAHCRNCRTLPATRKMLIDAYQVIGAEAEAFECPEGFAAETAPEPEATIANPLAGERLTICTACGWTDCGIKHQTQCRRKAILSRKNFHCPQGNF